MKEEKSICPVCGKEYRSEEALIIKDKEEKAVCIDCAIKYVTKNRKCYTITLELCASK